MRQISRRMEMIYPMIGWRLHEQGTHKHAYGSWILWSVSRVRSKTMHSLSCITSWLPYITLHYLDSRFFLPLEQSCTALLGCRLTPLYLLEAARWQYLSRDNNITIGLALNRISAFSLEMLFTTDTLGACLLLCEVSQKCIQGISRYLWISTKRVYILHELKAGLNADKFATFWMFLKSFYQSLVFQMTFIHSTNG